MHTPAAHLKILTFTTLYPNSEMPQHGIFTKTSLGQVLASGQVASQVVAPIPWFPFAHGVFGRYGAMARSHRTREEGTLAISHPRFPVLPKVGQLIAPVLLALASIRTVRRILRAGYDFDVIDAHYFYPDGVAAVLLGRWFKKPVVIKALGSDINVLANMAGSRRAIAWAARQASAVTTVSAPLKQALIDLGVDADQITVLRNGVDLDLFHPDGRDAARTELGIAGDSFSVLSVGNLIEAKGHHLALGMLPAMPDARLVIAGHGRQRQALARLAARLGVAERVQFVGSVPQARLAQLYKAADALVLASRREGWANVLLEAMACGTPVVASAVSGNREVVRADCAGVLFSELSVDALSAAMRHLRAHMPARSATRRYAEQFSWAAPTASQIGVYAKAIAGAAGAAALAPPEPAA